MSLPNPRVDRWAFAMLIASLGAYASAKVLKTCDERTELRCVHGWTAMVLWCLCCFVIFAVLSLAAFIAQVVTDDEEEDP